MIGKNNTGIQYQVPDEKNYLEEFSRVGECMPDLLEFTREEVDRQRRIAKNALDKISYALAAIETRSITLKLGYELSLIIDVVEHRLLAPLGEDTVEINQAMINQLGTRELTRDVRVAHHKIFKETDNFLKASFSSARNEKASILCTNDNDDGDAAIENVEGELRHDIALAQHLIRYVNARANIYADRIREGRRRAPAIA